MNYLKLNTKLSALAVALVSLSFTSCGNEDNPPSEKAYLTCPDDHHPHLIDLGLPSGTKWACCNVGASTPEEYGDYIAWGETSAKSAYNWDTYQYGSSEDDVVNIGNDIADTGYDAATVNCGTPWRMPSAAQIAELINNTTSIWTTQNNVSGRKFTGSNGGTIFLPAAGIIWDEFRGMDGSWGYYWGSTLDESDQSCAYGIYFGSDDMCWLSRDYRNYGRTVRPVR